MPSVKNFFAAAALVSMAQAKTHRVTATSNSKFDPDTVEAVKGDIVEFHFEKGNHSVTSGLYDFPCAPVDLGQGFFSGFIDTEDEKADEVFRVTVNNTDPVVFYSSQSDECARGMVGIINPNKEKTLDDYRKRASKLAKGGSPPEPYGGELVEDDGLDDEKDDEETDDKDDQDDGRDNKNDDKDNKNDDKDDDKNDNKDQDDNDAKDMDDSSAGAFKVPILGLVGALAVIFALS